MKHTQTVTAWASGDFMMGRILEGHQEGDSAKVVSAISIQPIDMTSHGWVKVGTAEITVELLPMREMAGQQLATLEASLQKERADSQVRQNAILDKISKLQAREFNGSPA